MSAPADLIEIADAQYASLDGLAAGSREAQERQRQAVRELRLPLEVWAHATGVVFRLIPAGTFTMGSPRNEYGWLYDQRQHQVTLTSAFYCGKFPVTQSQWCSVQEFNPSHFQSAGLGAPVEQVSWDDCQMFLTNLCEKEGVPKGTYRLLAESEWEYACRAGTASAYCCGDDDAILDQYAWYRDNSHDKTHPVGQKKPNAWGLYDMHGNIYEWCQDWLGDYPSDSVVDPRGPSSGDGRVYRGGCWDYCAEYCRSAYRREYKPSNRCSDWGLRLARTIPRISHEKNTRRGLWGRVARLWES
jgi:formylglycine-generating enzyme required for sulfatase activity